MEIEYIPSNLAKEFKKPRSLKFKNWFDENIVWVIGGFLLLIALAIFSGMIHHFINHLPSKLLAMTSVATTLSMGHLIIK